MTRSASPRLGATSAALATIWQSWPCCRAASRTRVENMRSLMQPSTFTPVEVTGRSGTVRRMHPIERLRWVARSPEGDASLLAAEAADALAGFADDPAGLVIASRRLIERRPAAAPLWWLASRVLCALDPGFEAMDAAADLERDRTPVALAGDLPGGTIAIVGWPDQVAAALRMRGR